ncbi:MAG: AAA family ATPase [Sulfuricurvum sp.]|jgi:ABC-type multidrug transport system ATPase subunit
MEISKLELNKFKKINSASINLDPINILIGGNNAGKSSVLQGIHFSIGTAIAARKVNNKTFIQNELLYCPTKNFVRLRHGGDYQNQSNFGSLKIYAKNDENIEHTYDIRVYRGRNEGNVGCDRKGDSTLGTIITNPKLPFSVYVPGLAGIPQVEEYRSEGTVRRGVASGDANLYLRNVIYLILQKKLLPELRRMMLLIFDEFAIDVKFDPSHDTNIDVYVDLTSSGARTPIELIGTGVLQALQIFSYVTLFKPKLLLLDEPDSHLHPNNQSLLAEALLTISTETKTKILVSTHSRHIVDSLYDDANFIWLKNGTVYQQGYDLPRVSMLMDIGALDSYERLREGQIKYAVLTEDSKTDMLKKLLQYSGYNLSEILIYSYKTSSNINSAKALTEFIQEIATNTTVIVHMDNDFYIEDEANKLIRQIEEVGGKPFLTEGSDIESYFINPLHLSALLDEPEELIIDWLNELATENHNELTLKFIRKRDHAKNLFSRDSSITQPETALLLGTNVPLSADKRIGKFMMKKVNDKMHSKFGKRVDLKTQTEHLKSDLLRNFIVA